MEIDQIIKRGGLFLLAGPCVIESRDHCLGMAREISAITRELDIPLVFKASFDKANRSSASSFRGLGLKAGLEILAEVKSSLGLPIVTDIHESAQAQPVAEVADILQIPAFLCRQTDLLVAAARTRRIVNIKKGQFVSPWDMGEAVRKVRGEGNPNVLLTERGSTFGYNNLVVDMRGLPVMRELGVQVVYDATHSLQLPGGLGSTTGGLSQYIPHLARAAVACGVDGLFLEVHDNPSEAKSDATTQFPLAGLRQLLAELLAIDQLRRSFPGQN